MIGRVLLAALLSGILAGLFMGVIQQVRLTPLIMAAEQFETTPVHSHDAATSDAHEHGNVAKPTSFERTSMTYLTSAVTGAGFAALLTGLSFLLQLPITKNNGVLWGIAGFVALSLAPAAGLPPELPGMPSAAVSAKQIWWVTTAVLTGAAIWLMATKQSFGYIAIAVFLIALPHLVGAPMAANTASNVPAHLASQFAANAIFANMIFWVTIGALLGSAFNIFKLDIPND